MSSLIGRNSRRQLDPGRFSVLAVNWNTVDFLRVFLRAIPQFSPDADIIIVDNGSNDGSREVLRASHAKAILLPFNIGHGAGLDLAVSRVHTEFFVALDIDAFPVRADWLDKLRSELDAGSAVVGGHMQRGYAHPSVLAMRTADFRQRHHTFLNSAFKPGKFVPGVDWDVGERISMREQPHVSLIHPSEVRGPGVIGTVYDDIVYHNWFSSQGPEDRRTAAREAWSEAVERFLDAPSAANS
jgi:glycosyltransferase involved in cell wall biosynthesis